MFQQYVDQFRCIAALNRLKLIRMNVKDRFDFESQRRRGDVPLCFGYIKIDSRPIWFFMLINMVLVGRLEQLYKKTNLTDYNFINQKVFRLADRRPMISCRAAGAVALWHIRLTWNT